MESAEPLSGLVHITVAFDWGEEIDLAQAAALFPAEQQTLPRRRRTPSSIAYQTPPLLMKLPDVELSFAALGAAALAEVEATVFDFGAVAVTLHVPFRLSREELSRLAVELGAPDKLVAAARAASAPVFERIRPAIKSASWSDLCEEYVVFQLPPAACTPFADAERFVKESAAWLSGLLRLDDAPLSAEELAEATRLRISYGPHDVVLAEWAAAVVVDTDCEDTVRTIEFANVQLLELRFLDRRVDRALEQAYGSIHPLTSRWLPFWKLQTKPLRMLGDMRIGVVALFERTGNTLKLVGDQYLARLYRLLAARFRLDEWSASIRTSLDAAEGVYEILVQQAATFRIEFLEIIIVALILFEIVMALAN